VSERRGIVAELVARGVSERLACQAAGLYRSSYRYQPWSAERDQQLRGEIVALTQQKRRYGYRRLTALLRRRGSESITNGSGGCGRRKD
jgi:hypothetical protein